MSDYLWFQRIIDVLEQIRDRLPAPKPVEELPKLPKPPRLATTDRP